MITEFLCALMVSATYLMMAIGTKIIVDMFKEV